MAFAPVLEREDTSEEKLNTESVSAVRAEESEGARRKINYAMLINPELKLEEILYRSKTGDYSREVAKAPVVIPEEPVREVKPYLVENARADAAIFRADNPVNLRRRIEIVSEQESEEEENEDLRPTPTTIQYKTTGIKRTLEEGEISNAKTVSKQSILNKKEKIMIAAVVSVVIALFVLIIINSAIISNINNDISNLQATLTTVRGAYAGVSAEIDAFNAHIREAVDEFARLNGMVQ